MLTVESSHFLFHSHSEGRWSSLENYYRNIVVNEEMHDCVLIVLLMYLPVGTASVVGEEVVERDMVVVGGAVVNSVVVREAVVTCAPVVVGGTEVVAVDAV